MQNKSYWTGGLSGILTALFLKQRGKECIDIEVDKEVMHNEEISIF